MEKFLKRTILEGEISELNLESIMGGYICLCHGQGTTFNCPCFLTLEMCPCDAGACLNDIGAS